MKRYIILSILIALLLPFAAQARKKAVKFPIFNGTNISHWLSQSSGTLQQRLKGFSEADVKQLKQWGFDYIRLPVGEETLWYDNGSPNADTFALIDSAVTWCARQGMRIVVDVHNIKSHHFDNSENALFTDGKSQEEFCNLWRMISGQLRKYPNELVAYELLNEPVAKNDADWNRVAMKCYRAIRALEPRRIIVLGSNSWQTYDRIKFLEIPGNDPNIILSFHYYNPFVLTHYQASWNNDLKDINLPVHYPGLSLNPEDLKKESEEKQKRWHWWTTQTFNKERLRANFQEALDVANKHGLRLDCGEFGCLSNAPRADRMRWYRDMAALFKEMNISHANWSFREDGFGLIHASTGEVDQELVKILTE